VIPVRRFLVVLLFSFAFALNAGDSLPSTPSGYSWQRLPSGKSALLKPDGWYFKQGWKGQADAVVLAREDIDKTGAYKTGLTLSCMRQIPKRTGQLPSAYAQSLVEAAAANHKLLERSKSAQGPFRSVRFRFVETSASKESTTVCYLLVANDKTGSLFLIIFESPTAEWNQAWKKGEIILKKMRLDAGA
jgi:hypothetical protein